MTAATHNELAMYLMGLQETLRVEKENWRKQAGLFREVKQYFVDHPEIQKEFRPKGRNPNGPALGWIKYIQREIPEFTRYSVRYFSQTIHALDVCEEMESADAEPASPNDEQPFPR